ncbi:MAG: ABC transporter permease subunit [Lachnospiraceae bacterium]|nr:ABC transporter permease subunit [Lachnospiraceae bacterium]
MMSVAELLSQYGEKYLSALLVTWRLTVFAFVLAFALGTVITVMRVSPIRPLRFAADLYVQIFRNIPGAALLILLVYALPYLGVFWSYFTCVLIATTLIPSAFCSEYLMSGMNTIDVGQIEAARSLGMTFFKMIRIVVLPQALRSSVLPMTNLLVATMLTTSLASQVPMNPTDLTGIVSYINTRSVGGITAFAISAALYCATAVVIGLVGNKIDQKVRILR